MQLSKNAIGNLINRYKAVLKKCHLLNTFGSLALASALLVAVPCVGMAYTPTLDRQSTKDYLETLTYDDDKDPITPEVKVYTQAQIDAISSAYVVEVKDNSKDYYTTFTITENGADVTYGVLLKGSNYNGTTNTDTFATIKGVIASQKSTITDSTDPTYYKEIKDVTPAGDYPLAESEYTFSIKDPEDPTKTLYFAVKKEDGTTLASNSSGIKPNRVGDSYTGNFIDNYDGASGGAIDNDGDIGSITGDFLGNSATIMSHNSAATGGAIDNDGDIGSITGDFLGNSATASGGAFGGAIYNNYYSSIDTITGDFLANSATASDEEGRAYGGAIYSNLYSSIDTITGDFLGNSATIMSHNSSASGGAIYTYYYSSIDTITGDFIGNSATATGSADGGAINNSGNIGSITGDFLGNSAAASNEDGRAFGGAIYNDGDISIIIGDFLGNSATASNDDGKAYGGAIYTITDLSFTALDGSVSTFSGNFTQVGNNAKDFNAIYVGADANTLAFSMQGDGDFVFNDNIRAGNDGAGTQYSYTVNIAGANATENIFSLNNTWHNAAAINITNATLELGSVTHEGTLQEQSIHGVVTIKDNAKLNVKDGAWNVTTGSEILVHGSMSITGGSLNVAEGAILDASGSSTGLQSTQADSIINNGTVNINYANLGLVTDFSTANKIVVADSEIKLNTLDNLGEINISGYNNADISGEQYEDIVVDLKSVLGIGGTINLADVNFTSISRLNHITNDATAALAKKDETLIAGNLIYGDNVIIAGITGATLSTIGKAGEDIHLTLTGLKAGTTVLSEGAVKVIEGATLTLGDAATSDELTFLGDITVDGGTSSLNVAYDSVTVLNNKSITLTNGADLSINNNGSLKVDVFNLSETSMVTIGSDATDLGTLTIFGAESFYTHDFGAGEGQINIAAGGSSFVIEGDLTLKSSISANLNTTGIIQAEGIIFNAPITLQTGTLTLTGDNGGATSETFTGNVTVAGGTLSFDPDASTEKWGNSASTTTELTLTNGTINIGAGATVNVASFAYEGGTLTLGDASKAAIINTGAFSTDQTSIALGHKDSVISASTEAEFAATGTTLAKGSIALNGGTTANPSAFVNNLILKGADKADSSLTVDGVWGASDLSGGSLTLTKGTATIGENSIFNVKKLTLEAPSAANALFTVKNGATVNTDTFIFNTNALNMGDFNAGATITSNTFSTNQSSITLPNVNSKITAKTSATFATDGTTLDAGTLELAGTMTNDLTLQGAAVASDATLYVTEDLDGASSTLTVSKGTVVVGTDSTNATLNLKSLDITDGSVTVKDGSGILVDAFTYDGAFAGGLVLEDGASFGAGDLTLGADPIDLGSATTTLTATNSVTFDAISGATLQKGTIELAGPDDGTFTGNLTLSAADANLNVNQGSWELSNAASNKIIVAGGTLTVASGASLDVSGYDAAGAVSSGGMVATSGDVNISGTVTINAQHIGTFSADVYNSTVASGTVYAYAADGFELDAAKFADGVITLHASGELIITGLDVFFETKADYDQLIEDIAITLGIDTALLGQISLDTYKIDVFTSLSDVSESAKYDYVTKTLMAGDLTFANIDTSITPNNTTIIAGITADTAGGTDSTVKGAGVNLVLSGLAENATTPGSFEQVALSKGNVTVSDGASLTLGYNGYADASKSTTITPPSGLTFEGDITVDSDASSLTVKYTDVTLGDTVGNATQNLTLTDGADLNVVENASLKVGTLATSDTSTITVGNATMGEMSSVVIEDAFSVKGTLTINEGDTLQVNNVVSLDTTNAPTLTLASETSRLSAQGYDLGATAHTHSRGIYELAADGNSTAAAPQLFKSDSFELKQGSGAAAPTANVNVYGNWKVEASTASNVADFTVTNGTVNVNAGASFDLSAAKVALNGGTINVKGGATVADTTRLNLRDNDNNSSFGKNATIAATGNADVMIDLDVFGSVDLEKSTDMFTMKTEGTDFGTLTGDVSTTLYLSDADVQYIPMTLYDALLTEIAGDGTATGDFKTEVTGFKGSINLDYAYKGFSDTLTVLDANMSAPTYTIGAGNYGVGFSSGNNYESTFAGIHAYTASGTTTTVTNSIVSEGTLNLTGGGGANGVLSVGDIKVAARSGGAGAILKLGYDGTAATDGGIIQGDLTVSGSRSYVGIYGAQSASSMGVTVEGTTSITDGASFEISADGKFNAQAVIVGNAVSTGTSVAFAMEGDTTLTDLTIDADAFVILSTKTFKADSVTLKAGGLLGVGESNAAYDTTEGLGINALIVADGGALYIQNDKTLSVNSASFAGDTVNFDPYSSAFGDGTLSANSVTLQSTTATTITNATIVTAKLDTAGTLNIGNAQAAGKLSIVDNGNATAEWTADTGENVTITNGTLNLGLGTIVDLSKVTFSAGSGAILESALGTASNLKVGLTAVGLNTDGSASTTAATVLGANVDAMKGTVTIVGLETITIDAENLSASAVYQSLRTQAQTSFGTKANIDYGTITFTNTDKLTIDEVAQGSLPGLGKSEVSIGTGVVGAGETAHVGTVKGAGDITVKAGGELSISGLSEDGSTGAGTVLLDGSILGAGDVGLGNIDFATRITGDVQTTGALEVTNLDVDGDIKHGTATSPASGTAELHNVTAKTVSLNNTGSSISGSNSFEILNVEGGKAQFTGSGMTRVANVTFDDRVEISGGHTLRTTGTAILNARVNVGLPTDIVASTASFAMLEGNSQNIVVDPAWKNGVNLINDASSVAIGGFVHNKVDAKLVAGQNSFIVLGTDDKQWAIKAFDQYNNATTTSKLEWGNGNGQVSAALFLNKGQVLDGSSAGGGILVDGTVTAATAEDVTVAAAQSTPLTLVEGEAIYGSGTGTISKATVKVNEASFAANSLLVIDASDTGVRVGTAAVALKADSASASKLDIYNAVGGSINDAKLLIVDGKEGTLHIAAGFDNIDAASITNNEVWDDDDVFFSSSVLQGTIITTADGNVDLEISAGVEKVANYTMFQGETVAYMDNMLTSVGLDSSVDAPAGLMFISRALTEGEGYGMGRLNEKLTVATIEGAAQLGAVANVGKGGMSVGLAMGNAIIERSSKAALNSKENGKGGGSMTLNNGQVTAEVGSNGINGGNMASKSGLGIWLTPLYKWNLGNGFDAGGLGHSYDMGLGGIALGADYTNAFAHDGAFRFGIALNVGGGYSDSTGDFNETNNNFDFWGLSAYAALQKENFVATLDVGFSSIYNEVTQKLPTSMAMGNLDADIGAFVFSAGLNLEYTFKTDFMDITPHAGVRYMSVTTYGYDIGSNAGRIASVDESTQDVWYFPVGVTFSKDIASESGWVFTPKLDVGFIAAAGDFDAISRTQFTGVPGTLELQMQNVDGFAFNGGLGFELANKENGVSLGLNYNIQAGEKETSHMVFANFRYEF